MEEKKKTTCLFVFLTYLHVVLLKFNSTSNELSRSKLSKNTRRYVKNTNKKSSFFMIPIPKFILKKCLRPIQYLKFKTISLANT